MQTEKAANLENKITKEVTQIIDQKTAKYKQDENPFTSDEILHSLNSNEDGDAWIYTNAHRNRYCYDHVTKHWNEFAGDSWHEDELDQAKAEVEAVVNIYGKETEKQSWLRLKAEKENQPEKAAQHKKLEDAFTKRIHTLQSSKRKDNVLHLASIGKESLGISGKEWDQDPMILGCLNGVINLKDGTCRPGRPEDYIKTPAPTKWEGIDASCPIFKQTLIEIFDNNNELIEFLQRLFGYSITGGVTEHILIILEGRGRNGKDTLLEIFGHVLGPLAGPIQSEILLKQSFVRSSASPSSDIMALRGKRLVWASETSEGRWLNAGKLKWLVGGGALVGRAPYARREVSFNPSHTLFLLTNHKPKAPSNDYALWQRILLIPFPLSFIDDPEEKNERKRDPHLLEKLKKETPGVLAWLVRGCLEWQRQGLNLPDTVKMATKKYQEDEDLIRHFLDDRCVIKENCEVKAGLFYKDYRKWCEEMGHKPISGTRFGKDMKNRFDSKTNYKGTIYKGIGLKNETESGGSGGSGGF